MQATSAKHLSDREDHPQGRREQLPNNPISKLPAFPYSLDTPSLLLSKLNHSHALPELSSPLTPLAQRLTNTSCCTNKSPSNINLVFPFAPLSTSQSLPNNSTCFPYFLSRNRAMTFVRSICGSDEVEKPALHACEPVVSGHR